MANQNKKPPKAFSWIFMGTGISIILISMEVIVVDDAAVNAPLWVIGICGAIFFLAGLLIFLGEKSKYNNLLAVFLVAGMGAVGSWVALFGTDSSFSGGIPFLSPEFNISLARLLFGFGGLICFLIAGYAFKQQITRKEKSEQN
ncbi:hypothetical protein [Gracilimonas sp. BCB1]|uniref:hypothetical protein n=1 Tax=Gracilimonas sp. BCB1 TaxID=3152362 RepID=UPI0032D926AB